MNIEFIIKPLTLVYEFPENPYLHVHDNLLMDYKIPLTQQEVLEIVNNNTTNVVEKIKNYVETTRREQE